MSTVLGSVLSVLDVIRGWGGWAGAVAVGYASWRGLPAVIMAMNTWAARASSAEQIMRTELRAALTTVNESRKEMERRASECEARYNSLTLALREALFGLDLLMDEVDIISPGNEAVKRVRHILVHIYAAMPAEIRDA